MTIQASFQQLSETAARLHEDLQALLVTIGDAPASDAPVKSLSEATEEILGCIGDAIEARKQISDGAAESTTTGME
jgi:hypothetical protein